MEFNTFLYLANFVGVIAFAASGVFKGIKHDNDIFGVTLLGVVTAVGGGITRDIMLNRVPNALLDSSDIYLALITSLAIYIPYAFFKNSVYNIISKNITRKLVLVFDAIGLSIYIYIGANIAILAGLNTVGVVIMATITSVGGGVIRDILVNETPFILKEDIYAVLCVIGGIIYKYMIVDLRIGNIRTVLILFTAVLIIRLVVIFKDLNLPK